MADATEALAALRPDRWPAAPPGFPASDVAFALLAGALAGLVLALLVTALGRGRTVSPRRAALSALARTESLPAAERLAAEAAALRAFATARLGPEAAKAEGETWLATLDRLFATRFFTEGAGRRLGAALYAPGPAEPLGADLVRLVKSARA